MEDNFSGKDICIILEALEERRDYFHYESKRTQQPGGTQFGDTFGDIRYRDEINTLIKKIISIYPVSRKVTILE